MPLKKTLILSIDGLGTRDLGAYGNTWIETPSFDHLASRSILFEHVLANSTRLETSLAAMVIGASRSSEKGIVSRTPSIVEAIRQAGIATHLLSDADSPFSKSNAATHFDHVLKVDSSFSRGSASTWEQTHCASYFAQLLDTIRESPEECLLWAHYSGLTQNWDAPFEWRERLVEEGDPSPPTWTDPPQAQWRDRDPDEQLRNYQAMAAEIQVLDTCLGALLNELLEEPMIRFGLVSPRGYPLGEHRIVGIEEETLFSEQTSVPMFIADFASPIGWRSQALSQPSQLAQIVHGWLSSDEGDSTWLDALIDTIPSDSRVFCHSEHGIAVRTNEWMLIQNADRHELYVKPDDRWEFNDVSSRCPEIVELLRVPPGEAS